MGEELQPHWATKRERESGFTAIRWRKVPGKSSAPTEYILLLPKREKHFSRHYLVKRFLQRKTKGREVLDLKQRWVTPLMVEAALSSGWGGSDGLSGIWQLTLNTPLLKNKDSLTHSVQTRCHKARGTSTQTSVTQTTRPYKARHQMSCGPDATISPLVRTCKNVDVHKALGKLTPFRAVGEESHINDSDCQALPGWLSANTIQRGHLDRNPWQREQTGREKPTLIKQAHFSALDSVELYFNNDTSGRRQITMPDHNSPEMKGCRCQSCTVLQLVICVNSYCEAEPSLSPIATSYWLIFAFLGNKIILYGFFFFSFSVCAITQQPFDHLFTFHQQSRLQVGNHSINRINWHL